MRSYRTLLGQHKPRQLGLETADVSTLVVSSVEEGLARLKSVLDNQPGPSRDVVTVNAGAAIYAADIADSLESGIAAADQAIASGSARLALDRLVEVTNSL